MSTLSGPAFEEPDYVPPAMARERSLPVVEPNPSLRPPDPWMQSAPNGRWCVVYRYVADSPLYRKTYRADSPADLVRFMRDCFRGNPYLVVCKIWEAA